MSIKMISLLFSLIAIAVLPSCKREEFGNAIINPHQATYENKDSYFPFDYFNRSPMVEQPVAVIKENNSIIIKNTFSDGLSGRNVFFRLTPGLKIIDVRFSAWNDIIIEGIKKEYLVEKAILEIDKDPFVNTEITGHYNLQIREIYSVSRDATEYGVRDTIKHYTVNGKFKVYSNSEKEKGLEWINDQNEIRLGIHDSLGVYYLLDRFPTFLYGDSVLTDLLNRFGFKKYQVNESNNEYVTFSFIVDENGKADSASLQVYEKLISNDEIKRLKNLKELWSCWTPGEYGGRKVKSKVTLRIRTKG